MPLEKGSLVLVDYTAKVKDTNEVFETTREEEAKKTDLYDPTRKYEPRLVSVGEAWVLKGLDEALAKAGVGDKMNVEVTPDKGFGERDPNKVRMIPQRKLGDKADEVRVGDVVELDDRTGIVRYVGSGRLQVDFNHRLAGKTLVYDVNVIKKLDTDNDKITALIKRRIPIEDAKIKFNLSGANLDMELPEETYMAEGLQIIKRAVANDIFKFVPAVKNIKFIENYAAPQPATEKKEEGAAAKPAAAATEAKAEAK
ncbi:peptidylprolyl isomerase [Nitrososphaera viennensis]|uniref:Peptidyl-prolyl cis-trans isomerase n=1 Tax=Nitrososphaera viennensis TaxID=1034015 RepID=A0A977IGH2_9ARCH|nr:peptidylprolyl isomerase [Nitrososphaera viennensis]UVS70332.1 peptidylprolyl isomerase [Nitrososphaera viennensis]